MPRLYRSRFHYAGDHRVFKPTALLYAIYIGTIATSQITNTVGGSEKLESISTRLHRTLSGKQFESSRRLRRHPLLGKEKKRDNVVQRRRTTCHSKNHVPQHRPNLDEKPGDDWARVESRTLMMTYNEAVGCPHRLRQGRLAEFRWDGLSIFSEC